MGNNQQYWRGIEELENSPEFQQDKRNEFFEGLPLEQAIDGDQALNTNRRDFLKIFGFSLGAVTLAACNKTPVKYAVPYVEKPEQITPSNALYYASAIVVNNQVVPALVKTREGRPIKFEPNKNSKMVSGNLLANAHSSLLSLYDTNRIESPMERIEGKLVSGDWQKIDENILKGLKNISAKGKKIILLSNTDNSLLHGKAIEKIKDRYNNVEHVLFDAISYQGMLKANEKSFGKRVIPTYRFDKAKVVASFNCDFLGTWLESNKYAQDYAEFKSPNQEGDMNQHFQFEANLSMTGSNADYRLPIKASREGLHLIKLHNEIAKLAGWRQMPIKDELEVAGGMIKNAAKSLWRNKGKSLVVSGSNLVENQIIVNAINNMLGNYGETIDLTNYSNITKYDSEKFYQFVEDLKNNKIGALIVKNANPIYASPLGPELEKLISKVELKVAIHTHLDETNKDFDYVCPDNHFLESWNVFEPVKGSYIFSQPTISRVFNTRQAYESFLAWSGEKVLGEEGFSKTYLDLKKSWIRSNFNEAIEQGFFEKNEISVPVSFSINYEREAQKIAQETQLGDNSLELNLYQKVGPRDGCDAPTPWIHEMPDPVSKICWDNYVTISKLLADEKSISTGDIVKISTGEQSITLPAYIQPGQTNQTIGIALGYGRNHISKTQNDLNNLGANAYVLVNHKQSSERYTLSNVSIEKTGERQKMAQTQTHHSIEARDIVREASIDEYKANPKVRNEHKHNLVSLWRNHDYKEGHHWAMAIDLNKCNGCHACVVSCSIENNVPVVGKDEIIRRREMTWLRIDRYYSFAHEDEYLTEEKKIAKTSQINKEQSHYENVRVVYQPMLCQHCDNAPCETVCPVLATTHSSEGLNQMTYNRCVGTKYCANNCPYKVRRFNWFKYYDNDKFDFYFNNDLGKMVINPDVTVRSRGVMEKCSFCVQRIQETKLNAKRENRKLKSNEVKTACAQTCPTGAIVFGDLNDRESKISKLYENDRSYHALEELDVKPSIMYMTKIRNVKEEGKSNHHS